MTTRNDWNPGLYLQFANERTQPSIDLVGRIRLDSPTKIIDLGCGPGNSTQVLVQRWPGSQVTGADYSPAMIEQARTDYPNQKWIIADAGNLRLAETYDLVYSSATIQWIPNHEKLIPDLLSLAAENGALAVQVPLYHTMPISQAIEDVAARRSWKEKTAGCNDLFTFHSAGYYYDLLAGMTKSLDLWATSYVHVMESHRHILEMIKATGLKPYLERLGSEEEKTSFEDEVLAEIRRVYPEQKNGKVLFPFERLFFVAYK